MKFVHNIVVDVYACIYLFIETVISIEKLEFNDVKSQVESTLD